MSNEPLVSIIVPAYNCAKLIPETLSTLLAQDYPNIEIIVVNDGSKDNTLEVLNTYGDKIIIVDQANAGPPGARNNGIRVAEGAFVCFCDADDLWVPHKVRAQVDYLNAHASAGMVCSSWRVWNPDEAGNFEVPEDFEATQYSLEIDPGQTGWIYQKLLLDCICLTSAVMLRRETIESVGFFDSDLWNGDDYDYWLRTSRITEIHRLKSQMVLYRILPQSVNRTPTKVNYGYKVVRNAVTQWGYNDPHCEQSDTRAVKKRLAELCLSFGYMHLKSGDAAIAIRSFWDAATQEPLTPLPWAYLLMGLWKKFTDTEARQVKAAS